jgi:2-C-methyl-D-erythritol 4-phosphate cytidylyltransferase
VDIVCVHDAARPLVAAATVRGVIEAAFADGAATAASRPSDSVRQDDVGGGSSALDRGRLWLVETPQAFRREVLEAAHREAAGRGASYTDDASLVEAIGQSIRIVESVGRNLKVTLEADVALAAQLLRRD